MSQNDGAKLEMAVMTNKFESTERLGSKQESVEEMAEITGPPFASTEHLGVKKDEIEPKQDALEECHEEHHIRGWRFYLLFTGLDLAQFLVQLEMTIVVTALVAIDDQLQDFKHSTWVVNAYFLAWSGFLVLWSQFSHTIGRKPSLLTAFGLFIVASAACSAAQTPAQLYAFRGIQGLAGAGVFNLSVIISREAVPLPVFLNVLRVMALVGVVSLATGPLIGGAISTNTTWRWVFIINVPFGALTFVIILFALPGSFPYQHRPRSTRPRFSLSALKQLDIIGAILFLMITLLSVTAFQEADASYPWNSALVISLLVLSGVSTIAFVFWERFVTKSSNSILPILTWRFAKRRYMAMFASAALIGIPFMITLVQIPQRLQVLYGLSPLQAAIRLLPFTITIALGGILGSIFGQKYLSTPMYGQLVGAMLQLISTICFTALPLDHTDHVPASQYGFQVLMGFGSGISYITNYTGIQYILGKDQDLIGAGAGAIMQFRYVGAALGLAAVTAALNTSVRADLSTFLDSEQISDLLLSSRFIGTLGAEEQAKVLGAFSSGFTLQWQIVCGFVGAQIVANLLTF